MTKEKPKKEKFSIKKSLRWILILTAIIIGPILVLMLVITPIVKKKQETKFRETYYISGEVTKDSIDELFKVIRTDPQLYFYHRHLGAEKINEAKSHIYQILKTHKGQDQLRLYINELKLQVEGVSQLFTSLELPTDFTRKSDHYPQFTEIMWRFLYNEYKLTIVGACYKATYNELFYFSWDKDVRSSAAKLHEILEKIREEKNSAKKEITNL